MLLADMMLKLIGNVVIPSLSVLAMSSFLFVGQANAVDLSSGEVEARLDTTISYGVTVRVEEQDKDLIEGLFAVNRNDGDYNSRRGIVSNTAKFTSDLDLAYRNFGMFLRATGFFDAENENGTRARTALSPEAEGVGRKGHRPARRLRYRSIRRRRHRGGRAGGQARAQLGREHVHPERHQRHQPL